VNATATLALLLAATAAALLFTIAVLRRRTGRRQRAVRRLLDAADALEARLRTARSEIEAVAGDHIDDPVHDAMREMLRQRLWLREHGAEASVAELEQVRESIDQARARIELQLGRIERARAPVA
jgi:methyl-accepting chemotaxis protein